MKEVFKAIGIIVLDYVLVGAVVLGGASIVKQALKDTGIIGEEG